MHKILLSLFLLVVLFFPKAEVFAQQSCQPSCPFKEYGIANNTCIGTGSGPDKNKIAPITYTCPANFTPKYNPTGNCICEPVSAEQAASKNPPPNTVTANTTLTTGPVTSAKAAPCPGDGPGVMTAIGCVPTEPKALVEGLLKYGTLAAGGIAFLIMILAALQMITAEGNPELIKGAQEKFYSAIIGLLLIIFSVLLMQVIGMDILGLKDLTNPLPRNEAT